MDGFDKETVVAFTSLVQPVLKGDVTAVYGHVDAQFLRKLKEKIAKVLDLVEVPDDELTE